MSVRNVFEWEKGKKSVQITKVRQFDVSKIHRY